MKQIILILFIGILFCTIPGGAESLSIGGPYTSGDMITISGETNFNTDNQVLVEVYPASFGPTRKYEPSMTGGGSKVVPVLQTGQDRYNWSANMSSTGWKPDQYMVRVEVIGKDYRETGLLSLTGREAGVENGTGSPDLASPSGRDSNTSSVPVQSVTPLVPNQELKNKSTPAPAASMPYETQKPEQTQKSPLSTGVILVSIIAGVFVVTYKKE